MALPRDPFLILFCSLFTVLANKTSLINCFWHDCQNTELLRQRWTGNVRNWLSAMTVDNDLLIQQHCPPHNAFHILFHSKPAREDEVREWIPVPHDNYLKFIISSHPCCECYFYPYCSHVNNLKLHDVILTDQWGVVLKITTQYDTEPKIDFK